MPILELSCRRLARHLVRTLLLLVLPLFIGSAHGQYLISGRVTDGTSGVTGVTVTAQGQGSGGTASTDASGNYSISLPQGTYSVASSKAGFDFAPVSCLLEATCATNATITVGSTTPSQTNVNFSVVYSVGGRILEGIAGLSGVQVTVQAPFPQSGTTDQNGNYTLSGFQRGSYTVTPAKSNYTFEPTSLALTVTSNVTTANFAGHALFTVGGQITSGRSPVPGVTVTLQNSQTTLTQQTDSNGYFSFSSLVFGTYSLIPSLAGYSFTPPSASVSGAATVNFTVATHGLSGRVTDVATGLGISGVAVAAWNGTNLTSAATDANGYYAFKNLAGTYTITPSSSGQTFNPAHRTLSAASQSGSVDFQRAPTTVDTLVTTCDFPSLQLALSAGGTVAFDCGGTVATIAFTETVTITNNTILDAQGFGATLSGGNAVRLFTVSQGAALSVKGNQSRNVTLSDGTDAGAAGTNGSAGLNANGGAILNDGGSLVLNGCVLSANSATGGNGGTGILLASGRGGDGGSGGAASGGAIFNNGGSVFLTNCAFQANSASGGSGGTGADAGSFGNGSNGGAGGQGGTGQGGALCNTAGGAVVIYDCTFSSNQVAGAVGGTGGAATGIGADGSNGEPGPGLGGGLCNLDGTLTILFSAFLDNHAGGAQGGDGKDGVNGANGVSGTSGSLAAGGAVYNSSGSVTVTNCTLDSNSLSGGQGGKGGAGGSAGLGGNGGNGGDGGSARGGALCTVAPGSVVAVNCTITGNDATGGSGGAGGAAGNAFTRQGRDGVTGADYGGGIANDSGTLTLMNTMVGYSGSGGNGAGALSDGGSNLSDDASFALTAAGSTAGTNLDLGLGLAGDNGGKTWTVPILSAESPAVNQGNDTVAPPVDQRHQPRFGPSDIGAYEFIGTRPAALLTIDLQTNIVLVSWTNTLNDYSLQSSPGLSPPSWTAETNRAQIGNLFVVTNDIANPSRFYRLIQ